MFETNNSVTKIDGVRGKYNESNVTNPSIRYGRNAVQNFYSYMAKPIIDDNNATPPILDFSTNPAAVDKNVEKMEKYVKENDIYLNSLPPLEYEYRYMPNIHKKGEIDSSALLGAAFEELGGRKEINVNELDNSFALNENYSTAPMDINKDGKIDLGEYGSTILAADMLSKHEINPNNIDGTITSQGHKAVQELTKKANAKAATQLYSALYNQYNLINAVKTFNPD